MSARPPVTLCIINRNGADHLLGALQALHEQPWQFAEILLVDDASEDRSVALMRDRCPAARVVELPESRGPGGARNAGLAAASHDLVLFQDNDVRLLGNLVDVLLSCLQARPAALLVTPRIVYDADRQLIQYESADCHFLALMATRNANVRVEAAAAAPASTTSVVTACFLIDRSRWTGGEYFDETYGFNLEDHDFGVRAQLRGHELWVDSRACAAHGDGTPGLSYRPGQSTSPQRLFYLIRNRWFVIAKCYSLRTLLVLAPALLSFELCQLFILAVKGSFATWWRALRSFSEALPRLRRARRAIQRGRRVADGAVLRGGPLPFTDWLRRSSVERVGLDVLNRLLNGYWRLVSPLLPRNGMNGENAR